MAADMILSYVGFRFLMRGNKGNYLDPLKASGIIPIVDMA